MYYIARSSTAETGTLFEVTYVAPATAAGATALYAWLDNNSGNEAVESAKDTPRRFTVAVAAGDFINTADNSINTTITVGETADSAKEEIITLLRRKWLAANFNGFTSAEVARATNYARRLLAATELSANNTVARQDRIKTVANSIDFEQVGIYLSTAWDAALASTNAQRAIYPWPSIASNATAGSVGLTTPYTASQVARPTQAQQDAVNIRAVFVGA